MTDLSIQIVNFKTKAYVKTLIESVVADLVSSTLSWNLFVLENASGDDLSELKEQWKGDTRMHFLESSRNGGYGAGQNILTRESAKVSPSECILSLNPDVRFKKPGTIERLVVELRAHPEFGIIGPRLVDDQGKTQRWDHAELKGLRAWFARSLGRSVWIDCGDAKGLVEVSWVAGTVSIMRRSLYDALGGFDESFFLYKEEEDLCLRVRQKGFKVGYLPEILAFHQGGVVASRSEHMDKSIAYFRKKHLSSKWYYPLFRFF